MQLVDSMSSKKESLSHSKTSLRVPNEWEAADSEESRIIKESHRYIVENYSPMDPFIPITVETENFDLGATPLDFQDYDPEYPYVYRSFFYGKDHKNFLGFHPELGSICISLCKESDRNDKHSTHRPSTKDVVYTYRGLFRTQEKFLYLVKTESELILTKKGKPSTKDVLTAMFPTCDVSKLKEIDDAKLAFELLTMEEKMVQVNYKFGVLYCKADQTLEDDMFSNKDGSELFNAFLNCIGRKVTLKGFTGFRGGLDVREDTTGTHSVISKYRDIDVMFHVSTLLPYSDINRQQIQRKAHLGNDIGLIVFKESGSSPNPFDPTGIVSQFPHVFLVVEHVPNTSPPKFRVSCSRRDDVPAFGPYPPHKTFFELDNTLKQFILAKVIGGENASFQGSKFSQLRSRTRKALLEDLTKTFLRKASLGSLSNLRNSIFGTSDSINKVAASPRESLGVSNRPSFTLPPAPSDSPPQVDVAALSLSRHKSMSGLGSPQANSHHIKFQHRLTIGAKSKPDAVSVSEFTPFDTDAAHDSDDAADPLASSTSGYYRTEPNTTAPKASLSESFMRPESRGNASFTSTQSEVDAEKLKQLSEENQLLRRKLELKNYEYIDKLKLEKNDLKLQIELKETKIRLMKAMTFIESMRNDADNAVKDLASLLKPVVLNEK